MGIVHDSDRALKRRWYGQKLLNVIKMLGLPSKMTMWEGFKFKAYDLGGGVEGGFIISPPGLVVIHMGSEEQIPGVKSGVYNVMVADNWMGAINHKNLMHNLIINPDNQTVASGVLVNANLYDYLAPEYGGDPEGTGTWEIQPFRMIPSETPKITGPFGSVYPVTHYDDLWGNPRMTPYLGELFWLMGTGMHYYDDNQNGYWEEFHYVTELTLNFYASDGSHITRTGLIQEVGELGFVYPNRIYPGMPLYYVTEQETIDGELVDVDKVFSRYGHMHTVDYDRTSGDRAIIGEWIEFSVDEIRRKSWSLDTIMQVVGNSTLEELMNDHGRPHGNYQFAVGDMGKVHQLHLTNNWYDPVPTAGTNTELVSFFGSNPSYLGYAYAIYFWKEGGSIYHWTFLDILPLLESLSDNPIETSPGNYDMQVVHYLTGQLFCWPNDNFTCAFDSAMFHSHSENVYTWSRHYGGIRFSTSGISAVTLYFPTAVTANLGVRPEIALGAGNKYTLVARKPGKLSEPFTEADWVGVYGVFVGTPFSPSSWLALPDPPEHFRLRQVKPLHMKVDELSGEITYASFVGVAEQFELVGGQTELPQYPFRVCMIQYIQDQETMAWSGNWQLMSPIPHDVGWHDQFDVGFYGIGPFAEQLRTHPDPANVLCTMPVQPYQNYINAGYP